MKKRLGEILIERQLLTVEQLNTALVHQRQWSMRLGAALVAKGFITEGKLTQVLSEFLGIPMVDMAKVVVDQKALELVPVVMCEQHDVFPISLKAQKGRRILVLAMADPLNFSARDELAFSTGCLVQPAIAQLSSLNQAIRRFYHGQKIEITPLNFDRTPLSSSGRPVTAPRTPGRDELPAPKANWMSDVERPALGGPGREPMPLGGPVREAAAAGGQNWLGEEVEPEPVLGVLDETLPLVEVFADEPTGTYAVTKPGTQPPPQRPVPDAVRVMGWDATESIEERFWALVRALSARGLITREEFLAQLRPRQ